MFHLTISLIVTVLVGCIHSNNLPDYIQPCNINDPKLSECILKAAQRVGPRFAKGVPELELEPLDPLHVGKIDTNTAGLKFTIRNLIVKGISKMELKNLTLDLDNLSGTVEIFGNMSTMSDYEMNGRVLILPVRGKGKSSIKLTNVLVKIFFKLKMTQGRDGKVYFEAYDVKNKHTVENVRFHLDGLFGGDEQFGRTFNRLMNDNWRELLKDFGGPTIDAVAKAVLKILNNFYAKVSLEELFDGP